MKCYDMEVAIQKHYQTRCDLAKALHQERLNFSEKLFRHSLTELEKAYVEAKTADEVSAGESYSRNVTIMTNRYKFELNYLEEENRYNTSGFLVDFKNDLDYVKKIKK